MIIAIEGLDASGKATQSKILCERLNGTLISFPVYSTPAGEAILGNLKGEWAASGSFGGGPPWEPEGSTNALVLQALMTINRFEMMPAITELRARKIPIVFDRYYASGVVYGVLDGLDRAWVDLIQACLPEPDVWIYLDVTPEESARRRPERRDRYERDAGLMDRVRGGYLSLWWEHTNDPRWQIVNGEGSIEEVARRIGEAVGRAGILV